MPTLLQFVAIAGPSLLIGFGAGAAYYRRTVKRDPEKLERLAKEVKEASRKAGI